MKRAAIVVTLASGMVLSTALPGLAQPLDEWLDRAAHAEYEGRQVTICNTPDGTVSEVIDVAQEDGVVRVGAPGGELVIRAGALMATGPSGATDVTSVEYASRAEVADRYAARRVGQTRIANRLATIVEVVEGDLVRLRYAFDAYTGAILRSDVNNGDGTTYCTTEFIEFRPQADLRVDQPVNVREHLLVALSRDVELPDEVAGFTRLDTYEGPQGSTAAFYSDGIFSFTVIVADRKITVSELRGAPMVEVGGRDYVRRFMPGQVVYAWEYPDGGLVLIGDLPPDLQVAVLDGLPEPGTANFLVRIWRSLFR